VVSRSSCSVVFRGQSVVLIVVVSRRGQSFFSGQSFFLVVVVSLLRDQSFFVDVLTDFGQMYGGG